MNPLLSIIIPCYNSADTLKIRLKEFEHQCNENIEIIVIDDCSKDDSFKQLQEFAKNSSLNLLIYRNEINKGPGESRNYGITLSTGLYLTFLDSDDAFAENFISEVASLLDGILDCIIFDFAIKIKSKLLPSKMILAPCSDVNVHVNVALVYTRGCTWGKIYRSAIIKDNNIKYLNMKRNEDTPFTKIAIAYCNNIKYINHPYYYYVMNDTSLMHTDSLLDPSNAQIAFETVYSRLHEKFPQEVEAIFIHEYLYSTALTNTKFMSRKEWIEYVKKSEKKFPNYKCNKYYKDYPKYIRIVVSFIRYKMFYSLKILLKLKELLK